MTRVGHKHSLSEGITTRRETKACTTDIKEALTSTKIKTDILESLIGNLNHAEHVIPTAR